MGAAELETFEGAQVATLLTPTTVCLVTARDEQGECVATCAWVNPLSHEPSLIGVGLRPGGRTARAIEEGGCFCANVLPAGARGLALACGKKGAGQPERFDAAGLEAAPCERVGAVRIGQASAWIECELVESRDYGDHRLFVGRTLLAQGSGEEPLLMKGRSSFGCFTPQED